MAHEKDPKSERMNLDTIEKLIQFMEQHGLTELQVREDALEFKARRGERPVARFIFQLNLFTRISVVEEIASMRNYIKVDRVRIGHFTMDSFPFIFELHDRFCSRSGD